MTCYVSLRKLHPKVPTDLSGEVIADFSVAWNRRPLVLRWVVPPGMTGPFPQKLATARLKVSESGRDASYRDFEFLVVDSGGIDRVRAIEVQSLSKRNSQ